MAATTTPNQLATDDDLRRVAEALSRLGPQWMVLRRPRIGLDRPDFLAVHGIRGACLVTVVSWGPDSHVLNDHGLFEALPSDPAGGGPAVPVADQPHIVLDAARDQVYDTAFAMPSDPSDATACVRTLLIAPQMTNAQARQLFTRRGVSAAELASTVWGREALDEIDAAVAGLGCPVPNPASISRLLGTALRSEPAGRPERPARLSAVATLVQSNPTNVRRRRLRGAAGTGKSFALTARAARLAAEGKSVAILSFNTTLSSRLGRLVADRCAESGADPTSVVCTNFHSLCERIVLLAEAAGHSTTWPEGSRWPVAIVARAREALEHGFEFSFDAILVDEGQDVHADWLELLADHVLADEGELLLAVDPNQDLYGNHAWHDEAELRAAGFTDPWIEFTADYRLPPDVADVAYEIGVRARGDEHVPAEPATDRTQVVGVVAPTVARWTNIDRVALLGTEIGKEVVRLVREHPTIAPGDIVFLCDYHHDGLAAVSEIERAGIPVHHQFSRDPAGRGVRRRRFWRDAPGVKGSTVHGFKGWDSSALVMGIGADGSSAPLAAVAIERLSAGPAGASGLVSIINADQKLRSLGDRLDTDSFLVDPTPLDDAVPQTPSSAPDPVVAPSAQIPSSAPDPVVAPSASNDDVTAPPLPSPRSTAPPLSPPPVRAVPPPPPPVPSAPPPSPPPPPPPSARP